jgi:glutamate---cysteine ligase / carboxylate-amine ligase
VPTAAAPYDEAFDQAGRLRPAYAAARERWGRNLLCPTVEAAASLTARPLGDDARILPVPWLIDEGDYATVLRPGVVQRAGALQRLFADTVLGHEHRCLLADALATEGNEESLDQLRACWAGRDRDDICFVYAPDLVRDPAGRWTVLEDNVGCVGGSADSFFVADAFARATGLAAAPAPLDTSDLAIAVGRWLGRRNLRAGSDAVVALMGCESSLCSRIHEHARRQLILDALGIPVVGAIRSPAAIVNFDPTGVDGAAFARRRVPWLNALGTGVLGNKALLPHVDATIRHSCAEEPLLRTPDTAVLRDPRLPDDPPNWVVKSASGSQGTDVFMLDAQPERRLGTMRRRIPGAWPAPGVVIQRYVEPSRLAFPERDARTAYRLELRPIVYVLGWREIYVGEQLLGKAIPASDSRRLNNVAQGAAYVAVVRTPTGADAGRPPPGNGSQ